MSEKRATCLNCMDGRVQLPVQHWIKKEYKVDFVDVITEAGMNAVLANKHQNIQLIKRSIKVSIELNKSKLLCVVGHYDCRGNPVDYETHIKQIKAAVKRLKTIVGKIKVVGLWVNDSWEVEEICKK